MRVWICQCICPNRHCIAALAGEHEGPRDANEMIGILRDQMAEFTKAKTINPWCGICKAKADTWQYDLGRTPFRSLEEAKPYLEQNEREQALARIVWGDDRPLATKH